jgi:23S rRNA (cytidine1920-2'-O)/16S rRNA (cytidine1409-2'-O)-methyltransferase
MADVVGRAEYKIAGAFKEFGADLRGKLVLDIGSSTGGFTEFALRQGAAKVIAVEKGTKQMKAPLRFSPQVELHEKQDIFEFIPSEKPDVILADVSFVSLRKVLTYAKKNLVKKNTEFLVMLKPQFEAPDYMLRRGVLKNNKMRREIIINFEAWLKEKGFFIVAKKDNEVAGRFGNVERFYYLRLAK